MTAKAGLVKGLRFAMGRGQPSISMASLAFGGAALVGGTAYFTYRYTKAHTAVQQEGDGPIDPGTSFRVFDQIAQKYDDAIGQEEAALWYGMMRKWLLREARGEVLEVSVGTGRNFEYYDFAASGIKSLTCTDLSQHMLLRAEDKFFDELHLGHKHPNVRINFCLADAHCLVDPNAKLPPKPEPPVEKKEPSAAAAVAPRPRPQPLPEVDPASAPWWAYWRRLPPVERPKPAEAAPSSAPSEAGQPASSTEAAVSGDAMPGLHAGGLLNFFRVLLPSSDGSKQAPAAAGEAASAEAAGGASSHEHAEASSCCSCHSHSRGYSQRCSSGQHESGAPLQKFAPRQFDTVVDTFGLCSHEDPVQALKEMARVCKPGGKILLLEHGRSHYDWLNDKLDSSATNHQRKWGCLWNRDILGLIKEAGLQVDKVTRWHFGTSYYIIARPSVR